MRDGGVRVGPFPRDESVHICSRIFQHRKLILGGVALNVGVLLFVTFAAIVNQSSYDYAAPSQQEQFCISQECNKTALLFLMSMDVGTRPCDDFYRFACGNWSSVLSTRFNSTQVDVPRNYPVDYADALRAQDRDQILRMIDEIQPSDIEALQQLKIFFNSCTDTGSNQPVDKKWIGELLDRTFLPEDSIGRTLARINRELGLNLLFRVGVGVNKDNSLEREMTIDEPQMRTEDLLLGMFPRSGELKLNKILKMFGREVDSLTRKLGITGDNKSTKKIVELDEQIVRVMTGTRKNSRPFLLQPGNVKQLNLRDLNELFPNREFFVFGGLGEEQSRLQHMDWVEYMETMFEGIPDVNISQYFTVNVNNIHHVRVVGTILGVIPIDLIRMYLIACVLAKVGTTSSDVADLRLDAGRKSCISVMEKAMPFATAHKLVMGNTKQGKAKKVQEIFDHVSVAFNSTISSLDWMGPVTKSQAMRKVANIKVHISYPHWLLNSTKVNEHYEGLNFSNNGKAASYTQNQLTFRKWRTEKELRDFHHPVSLDYMLEFTGTSPATVNLFYLVEHNAIVIPDGYLRFPYFGTGISAIDYGALGSFLGHEIAHGFDSNGRQRDETGKWSPWWNITGEEGLESRTQCFSDQYEGDWTLNKDISDNWGLRAAFEAYQLYKNSTGAQTQDLPGLEEYSSEQLFFLSFAHSHCSYNAESGESSWEMRMRSHSPNGIRVMGSLSNYEEFSRVWQCPLGSGMNPEKKCVL